MFNIYVHIENNQIIQVNIYTYDFFYYKNFRSYILNYDRCYRVRHVGLIKLFIIIKFIFQIIYF